MQCINCNREIPDNSLFCNWCGKKQIKEKAAKSEALSNMIKENLEKEISNELKTSTNTDSSYLPPSDDLKNETNQNSPDDTEIINSNTTDDLQYAETKYNETQPTPDNTYESEEMREVFL